MEHPKPQEPLPATGSAAEERLRAAEEHEGKAPSRGTTARPGGGRGIGSWLQRLRELARRR